MILIRSFALYLALGLAVSLLPSCAILLSGDDVTHSVAHSTAPSRPAAPPMVYMFRGLGEFYSFGLDAMAEELRRRGADATATTHWVWIQSADEAMEKFRKNPAPIVLIGHSTGADSALYFASRLNDNKIPVALIIALDPTPVAPRVPSNVDRFVNLYQSTNMIGGGEIKPAKNFRGHLSNVDLHERPEILHVNLDKSKPVREAILSKIMAVASAAPRNDSPPLAIKYTVPNNAMIEIFDSGFAVETKPDDTIDGLARAHNVPSWAIERANQLDANAKLRSGQRIVVPRHIDVAQLAGEGQAAR